MFKKLVVLAICVVALTAAAFSLGLQSGASQISETEGPIVPDYVVYRHLFHHVVALKKKADESERNNEDGSKFRNFYKQKARLNDSQSQELEAIAEDCEREISLQDDKAKKVIDAFRALHPDGQLAGGETLPPPPEEIKSLQEERNAIVLRAKERISKAFGKDDFQTFDLFVQRNIASKMQSLPLERQIPAGKKRPNLQPSGPGADHKSK